MAPKLREPLTARHLCCARDQQRFGEGGLLHSVSGVSYWTLRAGIVGHLRPYANNGCFSEGLAERCQECYKMVRDAQHRWRGLKLWLHGPRGLNKPCTPSNTMAEPVTQGAETGTAPATTTTTQPDAPCAPRVTITAGRRRPASLQICMPGLVAPPPAGGTVGGRSVTAGECRWPPCTLG